MPKTHNSRVDDKPDVVMLSTADWDYPFWTNKQHTAKRLAERGYRVLYIDSLGLRRPTAGTRDLRRMFQRLRRGVAPARQVHERIWVLSPLVIPGSGNQLVTNANRRLLTGAVNRTTRRLGMKKPILWTYNPLVLGLLGEMPRSQLIYHCVDELSAAPGMDSKAIKQAEAKLVEQADIVFTTSPALQSSREQQNPGNTHYLPNVADYEHFVTANADLPLPEDLSSIPHPRIGFIGALSEYKFNFQLVEQIARRRPEWHWVLVGQQGEGQPNSGSASVHLPNIHFLGPRPYETLPDYLRGFDVATLPAPLNDYTRHMFPMKFFEYLAAGRQVVSTPLPAIAEFHSVCKVAADADTFEEAIAKTLANQGPSLQARLDVARKHTWETRLDSMEATLQQAHQSSSSSRACA